jgi:hypothetical protein
MRKGLDRLAAEEERGDAVATVRGHDDQVAALQLCDIDDRPVGVLILDLDRLACDTAACASLATAPRVFSACSCMRALYRSGRVLDHLCVGRERVKRRQDRKRGDFGAEPLG